MDVVNSLLRATRAGNLKRVIEFVEDDLVDINSSNQNGLTALHLASRDGHTRIVEELISRGANVHAKTNKGNMALHIASLAGHEPVVRVLIENGAHVDAQSINGFTPLYMAAQENHGSIVKLLLASGANQNVATIDGFTPLAVAMQQGHEQIASILLNNEAKGRIRFPGTTESGRSLLHIAAKKDDCAAAALLIQNNISPDTTLKTGFTALHVASHYGNEAVAKLLIDKQADVNYQAKHNITPLHVAAKWGHERLVDVLLDGGANIEAKTRDGLTPLHCAARSGHDSVVERLIKRGAPIIAKTRSGLAPLHMATQGDHLKSAQILINERAPVDDVTVDFLTSLHVASHCGHVKVAKLLLNNKADPNFRALNGFTPLHIACKKNHIKIVELLLKYGASLNAITESCLTPLHVASFMGCVQIVIFLLENNANIEAVTVRGETPLHLATRANQIEVIQVLLSYGANVVARAKESQTALHIASRLGNASIGKLLIENGIDVDAPTKDSYTALHIAAKEGHDNVVALLLNHGANISCATRNHGFTPLHLASKYGVDDVVDLLLSYGAPVDAPGKNGVTPLHVATHYDHPSVVQLLLMDRGPRSPGASPHAMAKNGYTALHIAAKGNRLDIASAILEHGANPNADSRAGFCPLHLAAQEGRADMADLLLHQGAHVNCRAKNGITPLHLCAQEDHVNVAQLLVKRGAHLDAQTKGGFTPLHVASHFARLRMIKFLLANGANVNIAAASGYTPLHQASQQGNPQIVDHLLQYSAKPDALTENGQTALSIAENLGYVSVIETLRVVTETIVKTTTTTITEERFKIVAPETMQETFVSDSEDEADDTPAHAESVKFLTTDVMKGFNNMADDNYNTSQSNLASANPIERQQVQDVHQTHQQPLAQHEQPLAEQMQYQRHEQSLPAGRSRNLMMEDEMGQDLQYLSREAPLDGGESTFGAFSQLGHSQIGQVQPDNYDPESPIGAFDLQQQLGTRPEANGGQPYVHNESAEVEQLAPDNVEIQKQPMQQAGQEQQPASTPTKGWPADALVSSSLPLKPFLVSFMVDARGGAMRGCRHSGVRVIIPPNTAPMPMRITCRYLRRERLVHPPPLMEGEACASKILEVGPAGARFLGPVLIEVPHFASLRGKEREIIILRSDSGEVWREHLVDSDDQLVESIISSAELMLQQATGDENQENQRPASAMGPDDHDDNNKSDTPRRLTRIVTSEFPQYFAIISRIRQQVHTVGPEGSTVDSHVVPRVQAIFTDGALTKRIKIGLQKGGKKQQDAGDQQPQETEPRSSRCQSPANDLQDSGELPTTRPQSAASQQSQGTATKRRSRFLACFGSSSKGSADLLDGIDGDHQAAEQVDGDAASVEARSSSPRRQLANEKPFERRLIVEDVSDSEPDPQSSPGSASSSSRAISNQRLKGKKQRPLVEEEQLELVPDDYYLEQEPPLILNVGPKTYGKRLASSSAQTDQKLTNSNGYLSSRTAIIGGGKPAKRHLLGGARRRTQKTQLTLPCADPWPPRPSGSSEQLGADKHQEALDSSLELDLANFRQLAKPNNEHQIDDSHQKWRTCTIQTDSDSVTVNYVTIHPNAAGGAPETDVSATMEPKQHQQGDDGYVSGSGDLKKAQAGASGTESSSFGKSLFGPFCASSATKDDDDDDDEAEISNQIDGSTADDTSASQQLKASGKRARKQRAKAATKIKSKSKSKSSDLPGDNLQQAPLQEETDSKRAASIAPVEEARAELESGDSKSIELPSASTAPLEPSEQLQADSSQATAASGHLETGDESLVTNTSTTTRSQSPNSKELKLKLKLERREQSKLEKAERQRQKKQLEEELKAEKARKKAEKEAKKQAEKLERAQQKATKKMTGPSATGATPPPPTQEASLANPLASAGPQKVAQSVTFASDLVDEAKQQTDASRDDASSENTTRLPQDCNDAQAIEQADLKQPDLEQASPAADMDAHLNQSTTNEFDDGTTQLISLGSVAEAVTQGGVEPVASQPAPLKPILKQQSASFDTTEQEDASAELVIGAASSPETRQQLVNEASIDAVRAADLLKASIEASARGDASDPEAPTSECQEPASSSSPEGESKKELAKRLKAEREQQRREIKAQQEQEKRLAREAKQQARELEAKLKAAEAEAQRTAQEAERARREAELQALIAMEEARRASEEAQRAQAELEQRLSGSEESPAHLQLSQASGDVQMASEPLATAVTSASDSKSEPSKKEAKLAARAAKEEAKRLAKEAKKKLKLEKKNQAKSSEKSAPKEPETIDPASSDIEKPREPTEGQDVVGASKSELEAEGTATSGQIPVKDVQIDELVEVTTTSLGEPVSAGAGQVSRLDSDEQVVTEPEISKSKSSKTKKQKKANKEKLPEQSKISHQSEADDATETSSSVPTLESNKRRSGFLRRLFRGKRSPTVVSTGDAHKPAPGDEQAANENADDEQLKRPERAASGGEQMIIVSEMYPSDPNDVDGEMILEVNVPKNLIENSNKTLIGHHQQQLGEPAGKPCENQTHPTDESAATISSQANVTTATTTTTTAANAATTLETTTTTTNQLEPDEDQEATLVNISQLADEYDHDDEEASENVISQANELTQDILDHLDLSQTTAADASGQEVGPPSERLLEDPAVDESMEQQPQQQQQQLAGSSSKCELTDIKKQKELEAKLEKEAKKRAKEEAKLRKLEAKEAEKAAKLEAKRLAKEEKERSKREAKEAKEAKRLAKKQKKQEPTGAGAAAEPSDPAKLEPQQRAGEPADIGHEQSVQGGQVSGPQEQAQQVQLISEQTIREESTQPGESFSRTTTTIEKHALANEPETADDDTDLIMRHSSPVNEQTEVERIVEESVDEDGTVTKRTKVVETKYVTMRQEELRLAERRDMPAAEWLQMQADEDLGGSEARARVDATNQEGSVSVPVLHERSSTTALGDLKHQELDEICNQPSYFAPELPAELRLAKEGSEPKAMSPKRELKKRFKLNERLVSRAKKLAKRELKVAKREASRAQAEIAVCDEAAKEARKQLKRAIGEAKRASKEAAKQHKKMDKVDKKLEKQAKKLEKKQKKLDKRAAKVAKKEAKKREKLAKKAAKQTGLKRQSSGGSNTSAKRPIKLEDIGAPVLRSSSKLSIGQATGGTTPPAVYEPDMQVEVSLDDEAADQIIGQQQLESPGGAEMAPTQLADLQARAAMSEELEVAREEEVEIDVVGDLDEDDRSELHETQPESQQVRPNQRQAELAD